jgi:hypothetical protein
MAEHGEKSGLTIYVMLDHLKRSDAGIGIGEVRAIAHTETLRESGNPVSRRRISEGLRSRFPLSRE